MPFTEILRALAAVVAVGLIGLSFGVIQDLAVRRNQKRQQSGDLTDGMAVMPGSMRRVAYLVVTLVLVQILCPLLFVGGSQWYVAYLVVTLNLNQHQSYHQVSHSPHRARHHGHTIGEITTLLALLIATHGQVLNDPKGKADKTHGDD